MKAGDLVEVFGQKYIALRQPEEDGWCIGCAFNGTDGCLAEMVDDIECWEYGDLRFDIIFKEYKGE